MGPPSWRAVCMYIIDMDFWPWIKTEYVLLGALAVLIPIFVAYLDHQRRKVRAVQQRLERMEERAIGQGRRDETRLHALLRVSQLMGSDNDLQGVFDSITNMCMEAFDCQQASLMLANEEGTELEVCAATGHANLAEVLSSRQRIGENIAGWVAQHRTPILIRSAVDAAKYPGLRLRDTSISSAMVVPIVTADTLVGVINVGGRTSDAFYDEHDLQALQVFAENVGTCIVHAKQSELLKEENEKLRAALSQANTPAGV